MHFIKLVTDFDFNNSVSEANLTQILQNDFDAGITFFRLVLEQSKDEFTKTLKALFFNSKIGCGKMAFCRIPMNTLVF